MPLSNAELQRRWRERHPGLNVIRVMESQKRHWAKHSAYSREHHRKRYHEIQDEAGCHHEVRYFYPGYRLLKAFEIAEVVEVKDDSKN